MLKILPVLDLLDGVVVRGIAGRRETYRPVESRIAPNADALTIARAFREKFGLRELYVADLDAILNDRPSLHLYEAIAADGSMLIVDAGLRTIDRGRAVLESGAAGVIAGLETSAGPEQLEQLCNELGPERVLFSLDMQEGRPMGNLVPWNSGQPIDIAAAAARAGIRRMIVLDLAQVGVGQGLSTLQLCSALIEAHPHVEIITGGGVRNLDDLNQIAQSGVHGALVASALHNGRITPTDVDRFTY